MPKNGKKVFRTRVRKGRKGPAKLSKPMVKAIQKIVRGDVETKHAFHTSGPTAFNSGIGAGGDALRILPQMVVGTGDGQRIGDQVRARSCVIKGFFQISALQLVASALAPNPAPNSRMAVRLMVVQPKGYNNISDVQSNIGTWSGSLLQKGATTGGFTGAISDLWAPINSEAITKYYDKVHYITTPTNLVPTGTTTTDNMSVDLSKTTRFFTIKLRVKNKLLRYDSTISSGISPASYAPVLLLGYANLDGTIDTVTTAVSLSFDTILNYEDA